MCAVSALGDHYGQRFQQPQYQHWLNNPGYAGAVPAEYVHKHEFEALKREVEEMKAILKVAKKYDEDTGQADCHMDEKVVLLKKVAELVGVDLSEVFGK